MNNIWLGLINIILVLLIFAYLCGKKEKFASTDKSKIIWIFWDSGFENAPELCKICLNSWINKNKKWEIRQLNSKNIKDYIYTDNISDNLTVQTKSDIYRVELLKKYGGAWVDATVYCLDSLDNWLPDSDFFAFSFKPTFKNKMIASWFLYSKPNGYIITELSHTIVKRKYNEYISEYFWFHYMFTDLYNDSSKFKNLWDKVEFFDAFLPHALQFKGMYSDLNPEIKYKIDNKITPMFKLDWKKRIQDNPKSNFEYLKSN